jgi:hypothetical protein
MQRIKLTASTRNDILVSDLPQYSVNVIMCNVSFHPFTFLCFPLYSFPGLCDASRPTLMPYTVNSVHRESVVNCVHYMLYYT